MAYVVAAKWRAHPGKADRLLEVIEEMTPPSRAEEGCVFYQAQRSQEDPDLFFLYEQYVDEAGYQAHMDSEHFTRLVKQEAIPDLLAAREREFYTTIGDDAGGLAGGHEAHQRGHRSRAGRAGLGRPARRPARRAVPTRRAPRARRRPRLRRPDVGQDRPGHQPLPEDGPPRGGRRRSAAG